MAKSRLEIIIEAQNKASKELKALQKDLGGVESSSKESESGIKGFVSQLGGMKTSLLAAAGTLAALGVAVKKAFEWGEEGALVEQTAESFDYLLEKVGAAPDLLDRLRRASNDTIDDMTLMSSTATLLAGASDEMAKSMAANAPQLLEIAKAASKLNPALGDTAHMYESIMTGIKRSSPLILDNLGITIKVGEANKIYAESIGKTVEELTAEEQKMALLNATLDAGSNLINQVGGDTKSATDAFEQLTAATKDTTNELKKQFTPAATDAAKALTVVVTKAGEHALAFNLLTAALEMGAISQKEMNRYIREMAWLGKEESDVIQELTNAMLIYDAQNVTTKEYTAIMNAEQRDLIEIYKQSKDTIKDVTVNMNGMSSAARDIAIYTQDANLAMANLAIQNDQLSQRLKGATGADVAKQMIQMLYDVMEENPEYVEPLIGEINSLEDRYRLANAESRNLATGMNMIKQGAEDGTLPIENINEAIQYLIDNAKKETALDDLNNNFFVMPSYIRKDNEWIAKNEEAVGKAFLQWQAMNSEVATFFSWPDSREFKVSFIVDYSGGGGGGNNIINTGTSNRRYSAAFGGSARQHGGPVQANRTYLVGEAGPEVFTPGVSGNIIPNNKMNGGSVNVYLTYAPAISLADEYEFKERIEPFIKDIIREYNG